MVELIQRIGYHLTTYRYLRTLNGINEFFLAPENAYLAEKLVEIEFFHVIHPWRHILHEVLHNGGVALKTLRIFFLRHFESDEVECGANNHLFECKQSLYWQYFFHPPAAHFDPVDIPCMVGLCPFEGEIELEKMRYPEAVVF